MQFPKNGPRSVTTRNGVGTAESGAAIHTVSVPGASTITWASSSRR